MQLNFASFWFSGTSYHLSWQGGPYHCELGNNSGAESHHRGSSGHLRAGAGGGGVCVAAIGQNVGREATQAGGFPVHAFGDETRFRKRDHPPTAQKAGSKTRTPRQSPRQTPGYSSAHGASPGTLPRLSQSGDFVSADTTPHRRGQSQRPRPPP